ncbi:hypothetical protein BLNAU_16296 [Blattamonas nauphoetae]|uniref:Right handed beta helix domain-containing protein n=1 Tax=Blattamonas nauphoetae TaxID=2049346 RepID=A0ABQ9XEN4_9EUKA|nr:hypothetical protein BLNAU_16296 [Blattamonas nauphoetae]
MLGCVVSLTSSHLSGSTIRDVNNEASILCSNSSFSSLLSSLNTDIDRSNDPLPVSPAGAYTPDTVVDCTEYYFNQSSGTTLSSIIFSNCRFTGAKYQPSARPLTFNMYPGSISIKFCSFDNIANGGWGGAVFVFVVDQFNRTYFTAKSSNFTNCISRFRGGAIYLEILDDAVIDSCRFEDCSVTDGAYSAHGGGLLLAGNYEDVDCVFADCTAVTDGAGVYFVGELGLSVVGTKFEHCEAIGGSYYTIGGGSSVYGYIALTVERAHFIECSSQHSGAAISYDGGTSLNISDTLVKDCHSGATGAICIGNYDGSATFSFTRVLFDGNSIGDDTLQFTRRFELEENAVTFIDVTIVCVYCPNSPTLKFDTCFTTLVSDSVGMIVRGAYNSSTHLFDPERHFDPEFDNIGPFLTAAPTVRVNVKTGKIELEMEGMTPPISQEYEVTVKADGNETETRLRMLFSDGTGTLVSGSESNLQYNTGYTITSMVGIVPEPSSSSSSCMSNGIEVPVAAWSFNLAVTPNYLSFTTPSPLTLVSATSDIISNDPKFAYLILHFDEKVKGSIDVVVLEGGKDVTITVPILVDAQAGESEKFIVVGEDRLLTHDTTYKIQSIVPTPGTDSPFVFMNDTITFHIPKSSYVPPEEPEEPEDPKKSKLAEVKKLLSWLIPLVACLLVALVLAIIIIVLLRRRQTKKSEPAQREMENQDQIKWKEQTEISAVDKTGGVIHTERRTHSAFDSSSALRTNLNHSQDGENSKSMTNGDLVEILNNAPRFLILMNFSHLIQETPTISLTKQ